MSPQETRISPQEAESRGRRLLAAVCVGPIATVGAMVAEVATGHEELALPTLSGGVILTAVAGIVADRINQRNLEQAGLR